MTKMPGALRGGIRRRLTILLPVVPKGGHLESAAKTISSKLNKILSKTVGSRSVCLIGMAGLPRQLSCTDSLPPVFLDFGKGVFVTREN